MPDLMAVIDGKPVPLSDCFWVRADARGCAYSSTRGDDALNAEQAHKQFKPRQRDRDRDDRLGFTVQLLTHEQWSTQAAPCFYGTCSHKKPAVAQ